MFDRAGPSSPDEHKSSSPIPSSASAISSTDVVADSKSASFAQETIEDPVEKAFLELSKQINTTDQRINETMQQLKEQVDKAALSYAEGLYYIIREELKKKPADTIKKITSALRNMEGGMAKDNIITIALALLTFIQREYKKNQDRLDEKEAKAKKNMLKHSENKALDLINSKLINLSDEHQLSDNEALFLVKSQRVNKDITDELQITQNNFDIACEVFSNSWKQNNNPVARQGYCSAITFRTEKNQIEKNKELLTATQLLFKTDCLVNNPTCATAQESFNATASKLLFKPDMAKMLGGVVLGILGAALMVTALVMAASLIFAPAGALVAYVGLSVLTAGLNVALPTIIGSAALGAAAAKKAQTTYVNGKNTPVPVRFTPENSYLKSVDCLFKCVNKNKNASTVVTPEPTKKATPK